MNVINDVCTAILCMNLEGEPTVIKADVDVHKTAISSPVAVYEPLEDQDTIEKPRNFQTFAADLSASASIDATLT